MKTLYLIRHAKSSWDNPDLDDFNRPLNERGKRDAPVMGKRLKEMEAHPNTIYSSPAERALATAIIIAVKIGYDPDAIRKEAELYHAGEDQLLGFLQKVNDKDDGIMIFGHNPGLTEFANSLLDEEIGNIPTAGFIKAELDITSWKVADWGCGRLIRFDYPKKK